MRGLTLLISALGVFLTALFTPLQNDALARDNIVSEKTDDINITIYQDPNRKGRAINANWPGGYALISETRTFTIPPGESQIRFEGVSEGMLPESAVVSGLPQGVIEKNRDERLLSPYGLVDSYLKRRVTIKRTSGETGKVTEKEVLISAGPSGGVIFESDEGFEALRCTGLPERIIYDQLPADLSAKPPLSIITESDKAQKVTVKLTYLAQGFDWQANYIANVDPDAQLLDDGDKKMNLFAWLTVANGGNQSFDNANLMAIAGAPNRENVLQQVRPTGQGLRLQCWPQGRTHQGGSPNLLLLSAQEGKFESAADTIVVRSSRSKIALAPVAGTQAVQENLGDLKLYRIPERVDVKAKGQKQVAMIVQPDAQYQRIYKVDSYNYGDDLSPVAYILRSRNKKEKGLGLPLPAGRFSVFENSSYGPLLVGEGSIKDRAIGNKVELQMPPSRQVRMSVTKLSEKKRKSVYEVKVSNAMNHPVVMEIALEDNTRRHKQIKKIDGVPHWVVIVPANDEASLIYKVKRPKS